MALTSPKSSKIVFFCSLANFVNAADRLIMPIAVVPMSEEYHWSLKVEGLILSAFAFGYISSQVIGGKTAQRLGGKTTLGWAVFVWSLSTFCTPLFGSTLAVLIIARILLGFAEGFCLPTIYHIFSGSITVEERSRAFGYLVASGSVGQTIAAVVCPRMPWRLTFYTFGSLGFLWVAVWYIFYREGDGDEDPKSQYPSNYRVDTRQKVQWQAYISYWPLWAIYIAHFAMNWSNYIVLSWLPTYLSRSLGADKSDISFTAFPYIANSLVGVGAAHYADSLIAKGWTVLSVRRLMTSVGLLGPALFIILFAYVDSLIWAVSFISVSLGLCAFNSSGILANHADVAPNHAAITFAISNTLATIPGIAAGPLTAAIVEHSGGHWFPVFILASLVNMVGAIIYNSQSSASQVL